MVTPRRDRREAALFRLECQSRPVEGPPRLKGPHFDLANIADAWHKAIKQNKAIQYFDANGKLQSGPWRVGYSRIRLEDCVALTKPSGKFHCYALRFSFANAKAADPGRRNFINDNINIMTLGKNGALDFGAHLVIGDRSAAFGEINTYRCVLEEMNGLGRNRVLFFLEELARTFILDKSRPTWTHTDRKNGQPNYRGKPKLIGYPEKSDTMKELLSDGRLLGFEFLKSAVKAKATDDLPSSLEPEQFVLRAKVKSDNATGNFANSVLRSAANFAKNKGWRLKTFIERTVDNEVKRVVRDFDIEATDLDDQLYARREPFKVQGDLPQCYKKTNPKVVAALRKLLDQPNLWI